VCRWASNLDGPEDWNIVSEKGSAINNRQVKLSRGKFLGGSSGINGTLCVRGSKQDYDDWGLDGWSGEEFFGYMRKASISSLSLPLPSFPSSGGVGARRVVLLRP
jgi:choline dehydrogenase-like flavoprotein